MTAIRPFLIGLTLILVLVLIALSILLVNPAQPPRQSGSLIPMQTEPGGANGNGGSVQLEGAKRATSE
ncbi:hypothetical protein MOV66_31410 [Agrobacterium sp. SHOUNA12C]|uniref:Uncharacterized protein n=1 Tax=Rhizobium rhizogenes NBRC 13257 TaxID=1220581 RepID=A0AA87PZH0_RHIRH|nr:hypothetical protein [Rhizobium rhizogenes]KAA6485323.1 hypothetical protein DXT98_19750 [Agrobacterium sp. ICMP 7243]MCJ9725345.1 hypothetical protein [Agrobacterium sp. BETTINA12B]MCJ9761185.1 hypothetical protein [Agrobacterium sp. SHOUNA12C]OCI94688.1 hypothetical protein A6U85_17335 [Agrobacterium sp. 13-626]OCJ24240.1 hypothetical protein A6U88_25575 [Agrobacterium sp. B131/95]OCJ30222.1 hypothetical protein A6U89_24435 [Agrobacterium sp. B133/95]